MLSHAVLHTENGLTSLQLWADSLQDGGVQTFRVAQANADEIVFQNENSQAQPQQLAWEFVTRNRLVIRVDAMESSFYRRHQLDVKTSLALRLGTNASTLYPRLPPGFPLHFQPGLGTEVSLAFGLRGKGPLVFNIEMGLIQRHIRMSNQWTEQNVDYEWSGTYQHLDFFAALVPELRLGKAQRFAVSAGFSITHGLQDVFRGASIASNANPTQSERGLGIQMNRESSLLTGCSWQLPKTIFPTWQPAVYCRGTWGLGFARERSLTVGVGVRLK